MRRTSKPADETAIGSPDEVVAPEFRVLEGDFLRMLTKPDLAGAEEAYI